MNRRPLRTRVFEMVQSMVDESSGDAGTNRNHPGLFPEIEEHAPAEEDKR